MTYYLHTAGCHQKSVNNAENRPGQLATGTAVSFGPHSGVTPSRSAMSTDGGQSEPGVTPPPQYADYHDECNWNRYLQIVAAKAVESH